MGRDARLNDALFAALTAALDDPPAFAVDAVNAFTRHKLKYIEHIPHKYFLPDAPPGALARLAGELERAGQIEMHPAAWIPRCLVDEGIEPLPGGAP